MTSLTMRSKYGLCGEYGRIVELNAVSLAETVFS
jgi:hypothetical protein